MDLSDLPDGFGFQFEVNIKKSAQNAKPIIDKITLDFH